ncbi:hypothetical protein ElyMa_001643100, partial [Elysia marginata]
MAPADPEESMSLDQTARNFMETLNKRLEALSAQLQNKTTAGEKGTPEKNSAFTKQERICMDSKLPSSGRKAQRPHTGCHAQATASPRQIPGLDYHGRDYSEFLRETGTSHTHKASESCDHHINTSYAPYSSRFVSDQDLTNSQVPVQDPGCFSNPIADNRSFKSRSSSHLRYDPDTFNHQMNRDYGLSSECGGRGNPAYANIEGHQSIQREKAPSDWQVPNRHHSDPLGLTNQVEISNSFYKGKQRGFRQAGCRTFSAKELNGQNYCKKHSDPDLGLTYPKRKSLPYSASSYTQRYVESQHSHFGYSNPNIDLTHPKRKSLSYSRNAYTQQDRESQQSHLSVPSETQPTGNGALHSPGNIYYSPISSSTGEERDKHSHWNFSDQLHKKKACQSQEQPIPDYSSHISSYYPSNNGQDKNLHSHNNNLYDNGNPDRDMIIHSKIACQNGCNNHEINNTNSYSCIAVDNRNVSNKGYVNNPNGINGNISSSYRVNSTNLLRGNFDSNSTNSFDNYNSIVNVQSPTDQGAKPDQSSISIDRSIVQKSQLDLLKHFQTVVGSLMSYISGSVGYQQTASDKSQAEQPVVITSSHDQELPKQGDLRSNRSLLLGSITPSSCGRKDNHPSQSPQFVKEMSHDASNHHSSSTSPDFFIGIDKVDKNTPFKNSLQVSACNNSSMVMKKSTTNKKEKNTQNSDERCDEINFDVRDSEIQYVKDLVEGAESDKHRSENAGSVEHGTAFEDKNFVKPNEPAPKPQSILKAPNIRHVGTLQNLSRPRPSSFHQRKCEQFASQPPVSPALSAFDLKLQSIAKNSKLPQRKSTSVSSLNTFTTPRKTNAIQVKDIGRHVRKNLNKIFNIEAVHNTSCHSGTSKVGSESSDSLQSKTRFEAKLQGRKNAPLEAKDSKQHELTPHTSSSLSQQQFGKEGCDDSIIRSDGSLQQMKLSEQDKDKQCPGCATGQNLNSRTFNIAIETSRYTCNGNNTDLKECSSSPIKIKPDVYQLSSESEE